MSFPFCFVEIDWRKNYVVQMLCETVVPVNTDENRVTNNHGHTIKNEVKPAGKPGSVVDSHSPQAFRYLTLKQTIRNQIAKFKG
jgi:hypothetical protein